MRDNETAETHLLSDETMSTLAIPQQPFDASSKHFNYYVDDTILALIKQVHAAFDNTQLLPIITGVKGAGKTALLSLLIARTNESVQYFIVEGNEHFSAYNVFAGMLEAFQNPAPDDLQECLDQLARQLQSLQDQALQAVILVDDAHRVPPAELYKLVSGMLYMKDDGPLQSFHIALAANDEFEKKVPQLIPIDAKLEHTLLTLPRLDLAGTKDYLSYRFHQAGYFEHLPLDSKQLATIFQKSSGVPGATNIETAITLNRFLKKALTNDDATSTPSGWAMNNYILGAVALTLVVISGLLFMEKNETSQDAPATTITTEALQVNTAFSQPPRLVLLSEAKRLNNKQSDEASQSAQQSIPAAPILTKQEEIVKPEPAPKSESIAKKNPTKSVSKTEKPQPVVTRIEKSDSVPNPTVRESSSISVDTKKTPKPEKTKIENDKKPNNTKQLESNNWVLLQNPERFTVQMIASSSKKEVERFLGDIKLPGPTSIFSFNRADEIWYALIHGLYSDIEDAQKAIKELPSEVRTKNPWIRQIKRIHDSLKTRS